LYYLIIKMNITDLQIIGNSKFIFYRIKFTARWIIQWYRRLRTDNVIGIIRLNNSIGTMQTQNIIRPIQARAITETVQLRSVIRRTQISRIKIKA
jgi:hypothetical protein